MKIYATHGINDFIICFGHKGYIVKEYFANYFLHVPDITFDMSKNEVAAYGCHAEPRRIMLVGTGEQSMTGGRLRRIAVYLDSNGPSCFTYGDGVFDTNITHKITFHRTHGKMAATTIV